MNTTTATYPTAQPTSTLYHRPIFPPPISHTDPIALQSLAVEIVGVLFAGFGLIFLLLQLRKKYTVRRAAQLEVSQVELQRRIGEEIV